MTIFSVPNNLSSAILPLTAQTSQTDLPSPPAGSPFIFMSSLSSLSSYACIMITQTDNERGVWWWHREIPNCSNISTNGPGLKTMMLIMDILCSQDFKTKYLWHHRISGTVSLYIGKPILIWIRISDLIESWKSCKENYYLIRSSQLTIFIFDDNSPTSHKWNIYRQEKASKRKFMLFLSTQLAGPVFATTSVCE